MRATRLTQGCQFTPERSEGSEVTKVRKSPFDVYPILFFKRSVAKLDEIRAAYIIFQAVSVFTVKFSLSFFMLFFFGLFFSPYL